MQECDVLLVWFPWILQSWALTDPTLRHVRWLVGKVNNFGKGSFYGYLLLVN